MPPPSDVKATYPTVEPLPSYGHGTQPLKIRRRVDRDEGSPAPPGRHRARDWRALPLGRSLWGGSGPRRLEKPEGGALRVRQDGELAALVRLRGDHLASAELDGPV